ncbi:MAG: hypothetical protein ABIP79_15380 [Chitinophagaceae bacterium]
MLIKIRDQKELVEYFSIKNEALYGQALPATFDEQLLVKKISKAFSNLLNSYTQAFNKMYARMGSLFMQNMKRVEVIGDESFCKVVHYIHSNPVHHRFVKEMKQWEYSSYKIILSKSPTKLERDYVVKMFGGLDSFVKYHEKPSE